MVNAVRSYDDSYNYGSEIHKVKSNKLNKFRKIMGGILLLSSFIIAYKLPDQDGNWLITAFCFIVAAALFYTTKETNYEREIKI